MICPFYLFAYIINFTAQRPAPDTAHDKTPRIRPPGLCMVSRPCPCMTRYFFLSYAFIGRKSIGIICIVLDERHDIIRDSGIPGTPTKQKAADFDRKSAALFGLEIIY